MKRAIVMLIFSAAAHGACFPVKGSRVLGRDLATAEPGFARLPATLAVGFAPAPGARRTFSAAELARIARANAISFVPTGDICFELPMRSLPADEATGAMRRALPADAQIKLVELQQISVPVGEPEFPASGLQPAQPGNDRTQLWRGFVRYADTQRAPIWARVTISFPATLPATGPTPPGAGATEEIHRGDAVRVEVECGMARLILDAVAVAGARAGELVDLRNPASGKTFKARLLTASRAKLVLAPGQTL